MNTADLPPTIAAYLAAHQARDADAAITFYTDDAVVADDGHTYRGRDEIHGWLAGAASEYTYTTEITGVRYEVLHHLEGDFPGGTVDLRYRFAMRGSEITQLTIEPR